MLHHVVSRRSKSFCTATECVALRRTILVRGILWPNMLRCHVILWSLSLYICIYTYVYTCVHKHIYIYTHIHTHTHMFSWSTVTYRGIYCIVVCRIASYRIALCHIKPYRCLVKATPMEKSASGNIGFWSNTSGAGEQFLPLGCRARACVKGLIPSVTGIIRLPGLGSPVSHAVISHKFDSQRLSAWGSTPGVCND